MIINITMSRISFPRRMNRPDISLKIENSSLSWILSAIDIDRPWCVIVGMID